ncbi:MAG: excinuclease ABC subunit UvrC, partial [Erysipelotrichaceae bacterium]
MSYIKDKLATLPMEPGCYLMKNQEGTIIYVGKALKLKARVSQYFIGAHDYKTTKLVSLITDFDYFVTHSEKEALLLEINLIKQHKPRFNISFMDDKSYPYIKLSKEKYPRLKVVRDLKKDKKASYFGPYPDASAAVSMRNLLNALYPIRKCEVMPKKVCLYYHLGQCLGPCEYYVDPSLTNQMVDEIKSSLKGNNKPLIIKLRKVMEDASASQNYEKAQEYRDYLRFLDYVSETQVVSNETSSDIDAFSYVVEKGYIAIQGLFIRQGKLLDRCFLLEELIESAEDVFIRFIIHYYQDHPIPLKIYIPNQNELNSIIEMVDLPLAIALRGNKRKLVELVTKNALKHLQQNYAILEMQNQNQILALQQLKEGLNLEKADHIELFDNSHIQGSFASSACVVYINGKPSKKDYRLYHVSHQADDYHNMEEVIYRRYFRQLKEHHKLPDLIIVDGGIRQIEIACLTLETLHLNIPVVGLSKDSHHQTATLLNSQNESISLKDKQECFFLLARMQDEVHRFVISHHKQRRSKDQIKSLLDDIEGIGIKRKQILIKHFKDIQGIQAASIEELSQYIPLKVAEKLKEALIDYQNMV